MISNILCTSGIKDQRILYIICITDFVLGDTYHILPFRRRGLRDGAGSLRFSFIPELAVASLITLRQVSQALLLPVSDSQTGWCGCRLFWRLRS